MLRGRLDIAGGKVHFGHNREPLYHLARVLDAARQADAERRQAAHRRGLVAPSKADHRRVISAIAQVCAELKAG